MSKFKEVAESKTGFFIFLIAKLIRFGLFFWFIVIIFSKTHTLNGYSLSHALLIYISFNIIDTLVQCLFREVYRFKGTIVSGGLDHILTKPLHPFSRVLLGGIDFIDLFLLIPYSLLLAYFAADARISSMSLLLYFALIINALIIGASVHIMTLAQGILTNEIENVIFVYRDLTGFGRFPFEIYREPLRGFLTFVIPVGIMMSFPAKALFGLLGFQYILIAFAVSGILLFLSLRFWHFALRRYQSFGG